MVAEALRSHIAHATPLDRGDFLSPVAISDRLLYCLRLPNRNYLDTAFFLLHEHLTLRQLIIIPLNFTLLMLMSILEAIPLSSHGIHHLIGHQVLVLLADLGEFPLP